MAKNTDPGLQRQVVYSVYVRNHTGEGTFRALLPDLDRIRALGTDIVWLMPIHPIGVKGRKGTLGCPYANRDYRSVNPEYGTMEDFRALAEAIRERGMKLMIDVVYNHTSPDSVLFGQHPEFFYRRPDGRPGNRIGDWTDVIDLDYSVRALWDYQIETLCFWAGLVDGFRCDVASFLPAAFWLEAREAVERVHPGFIWLAETVHRSFGLQCRREGIRSERDGELFEAFDLEYEYDIREGFDAFLQGRMPLSHYLDLMNFQESCYPANYNKLRFLENHDQPRIAALIRPFGGDLVNFTAMLYFFKGTTLLYAGQEFADEHRPSLFDKDPIDRATGTDLSALLRRLYEIKRTALDPADDFLARADDENRIAVLERFGPGGLKLGVFSLCGRSAAVKLSVPDGDYENLIDGSRVSVRNGLLRCEGRPIVFTAPGMRPL
ncbi:MAG: alpha-amylase [Oscillospiraceae bacterium]|nr:alpha-amylase [Oscillospiraceae bacterium]